MIQIDIEMPKCCDDCFALDKTGDYPYCNISQVQQGYTFDSGSIRMPECPLIDKDCSGEAKPFAKLKPCPFCGRTDTIRIYSLGYNKYMVKCCGCRLTLGDWDGLDTAISAWNRRVSDGNESEQNNS